MKEFFKGLLTRRVAVPTVSALLVLSGSSAFATADPAAYDPTTLFTEVTTWLTGVLLPVMVAMLVLGITVRIAIKAVRKYSSKVTG